MTKVRLFAALSLGTMLFASCEKQLEESPAPRTESQSSTSASLPGNWQLSAYTGIVPTPNSTDFRTTNIFMMLPECSKDDKLHFGETGELTQLPGAIDCSTDPSSAVTPGTWAFSDDQKRLTLTLDKTTEYEVTSLTATTLKLRSVAAADEPYTELEYTR